MKNFLLQVDYNKTIFENENFTDSVLEGAKIALIGIATVFAVILILWLVLTVFKLVFFDLKNRTSRKNEAKESVEATEAQSLPASDNNEEIVAAIAAAIAMAEGENQKVKFKVVSFRRK